MRVSSLGSGALAVLLLCSASATYAQPNLPEVQRCGTALKGSLLMYSKVDIRWDSAGTLVQDTFLDLTNDATSDVRVQLYFVNGDPPLDASGAERAHPGWNSVDASFVLTANQPFYWSAATGHSDDDANPPIPGLQAFTVLDAGPPPGRPDPEGSSDRVLRGFVVAWAVNDAYEEIDWNHLLGDAFIVNYVQRTAWEYSAHAFQANSSRPGEPTDDLPGVLLLNGFEYDAGFDKLLFVFPTVDAVIGSAGTAIHIDDVDLTLHPLNLDLRPIGFGPARTRASFLVWNMNETKFSGTSRLITCWDERLLTGYGIPNHFLLPIVHTDFARARIDGVPSLECDPPLLPAALIGVAARELRFGTSANMARTGGALTGMGCEDAALLYEPDNDDPPEKLAGPAGPAAAVEETAQRPAGAGSAPGD